MPQRYERDLTRDAMIPVKASRLIERRVEETCLRGRTFLYVLSGDALVAKESLGLMSSDVAKAMGLKPLPHSGEVYRTKTAAEQQRALNELQIRQQGMLGGNVIQGGFQGFGGLFGNSRR